MNDGEQETIEDAVCHKETAKAILVSVAGNKMFWVPKSVIHDDSEVYKANTDGKLVVAAWFAEKEGLG